MKARAKRVAKAKLHEQLKPTVVKHVNLNRPSQQQPEKEPEKEGSLIEGFLRNPDIQRAIAFKLMQGNLIGKKKKEQEEKKPEEMSLDEYADYIQGKRGVIG